MRKTLLVTSVLPVLALGCRDGPAELGGDEAEKHGVLTGEVSIGPLEPDVPPGRPAPEPSPEVYAERKIVVFAEDGETEVARVDIGADGRYRVRLPPGTYVVDINRTGLDRADGFPEKVAVAAGSVTRVDVEIDTGIR